jgi:hypothetical protein
MDRKTVHAEPQRGCGGAHSACRRADGGNKVDGVNAWLFRFPALPQKHQRLGDIGEINRRPGESAAKDAGGTRFGNRSRAMASAASELGFETRSREIARVLRIPRRAANSAGFLVCDLHTFELKQPSDTARCLGDGFACLRGGAGPFGPAPLTFPMGLCRRSNRRR